MMEILRRLEKEGIEGQELGEDSTLEERLAGLDLGRVVWQHPVICVWKCCSVD